MSITIFKQIFIFCNGVYNNVLCNGLYKSEYFKILKVESANEVFHPFFFLFFVLNSKKKLRK
jgi:hypothetical protein